MSETYFAPCPRGLEQPLLAEVQALGATDSKIVAGGVRFAGDREIGWRVNLHSRIASRVLRQLALSPRRVVYQVEHLELGRRFVLELLAAELMRSPELVQRTRADWQALSKLRHPNIVRVTDAGVTPRGLAFCVREQLRGETLRQQLQRRRCLAVPEALRIARELATALASAHAPFIYFDAAPNFGLNGGIANVSLEVVRFIPNPGSPGVFTDRVTVAHLRMSLDAVRSLKAAIEGIELMAVPAQGAKN